MKINPSFVNNYNLAKTTNQNFGNAYVTLSKTNLGDVISKNIDSYNKDEFAKTHEQTQKIAQEVIDKANIGNTNSNARIKTAKDLTDKVDLYTLAAGAGSRFKSMAQAVANLRGKNESFNKISVPFELGKGQQPLTMLDIPMAIGRFFAKKDGYEKIMADKPTGSFGDVIQNYLKSGKEPNDVVVCCGDNVFDVQGEEILDFVVKTINNPNKQLGVIGVSRTPDEVAKRFGVLKIGEKNETSNTYPLQGFVEKPDIETAKSLTTKEGNNVANTGMFIIKKETMKELLDTIKKEIAETGKSTCIAKDPEKEIYDFAAATKWTQARKGAGASDVKIVDVWEDVGEPKAYQRWMEQIKNGHYLANFTPERRAAIIDATSKRVDNNSIQFTINPNGKEVIDDIEIKA